jgi:hypothetical protein
MVAGPTLHTRSVGKQIIVRCAHRAGIQGARAGAVHRQKHTRRASIDRAWGARVAVVIDGTNGTALADRGASGGVSTSRAELTRRGRIRVSVRRATNASLAHCRANSRIPASSTRPARSGGVEIVVKTSCRAGQTRAHVVDTSKVARTTALARCAAHRVMISPTWWTTENGACARRASRRKSTGGTRKTCSADVEVVVTCASRAGVLITGVGKAAREQLKSRVSTTHARSGRIVVVIDLAKRAGK